jgi:hypothetical protein
VNVRRLFLILEESIDGGTPWVVFEPNRSTTTLREMCLAMSSMRWSMCSTSLRTAARRSLCRRGRPGATKVLPALARVVLRGLVPPDVIPLQDVRATIAVAVSAA